MKTTKFNVMVDGAEIRGRKRGSGKQPIVFLNGAFGTWRDWKPVLKHLDDNYQAVLYDMRGRGGSTASNDYSFEACERDLEAVISAFEFDDQPILVGWSYGAALAVQYAAKNPEAVKGLVLVDGAFPHSTFVTKEDKDKVRKLWRNMRFMLPVLCRLGKAGKMSADEHATINIDLDERLKDFGGKFAKITCPVRFILALKPSVGGTKEQFEALINSVKPLADQQPNISEFAALPCTHLQLLSKYPKTIVEACTTI